MPTFHISVQGRRAIREAVAIMTGMIFNFVETVEKIEERIAVHFRQGLVHQPVAPRLHTRQRGRR